MAKYQILEEQEQHDGTLITVKLIPEIENSEEFSEIQKYLVKEGEKKEDILSIASNNHESELVKRTEEPAPKVEAPIVEAKSTELIGK